MKRSPIKRVSTKRAKELRLYAKLRKEFLAQNRICQAYLTIWPEWVDEGALPATEVHHREGRGTKLNDVTTWLPVSREAHSWIHDHPGQARKLGLLK